LPYLKNKDRVTDLQFSPNGKYLCCSVGDKSISIWNWETKTLIKEVRGCTVVGGDEEKLDVKNFGARPNITFSPDSTHFLVRWE
jgi:WD40 repeat protein